MSLDYKLKCRCFQQGKFKTQPPYPEFLKQQESGEYCFDYPEDWLAYFNGNEAKADQQYAIRDANEQWQSNICKHSGQRGSLYGFSRQMGVNFVLTTYMQGGWDNFPVLGDYYPMDNEGILPLEHAPTFVEELKKLAFHTKIPSVDVLFDKNGETEMVNTIRQDGALLTQLQNDGTFGLYGKEGFYILQITTAETHKALLKREFGYSAAEMLAHPDVKVLFHSNRFFKTKTKDKYAYTDALSQKAYHSDFNYIRQMMTGEELNDGLYRWEMDEYDFEEYRDTFEYIIEVVKTAIRKKCDIEWR